MLKSIDILIGFSVVMLIAGMAVTVLTQIGTALLNTRGTHLRDGLANLLNQLHCAISPKDARVIATHILKHPLVCDGRERMGSFIHRDELIRLLLEAVSAEALHRLPEQARETLLQALSRNGIEDPEQALQKIREHALALESSCPALANGARHDLAILQAASSEFVAKINGWFDRTMDRVSARFTLTTRGLTLVNSIVVAVILQMDALSIVNRLADSEALRASLIDKAYAQEKLGAMNAAQLTALAEHNIFPAPRTIHGWAGGWHWTNVPGVAVSILLLSLGAPFWFEILKNMLRLREAAPVKRLG